MTQPVDGTQSYEGSPHSPLQHVLEHVHEYSNTVQYTTLHYNNFI